VIDGIPVDKLTAPVLLAIAVLMVLNGLLVPRRVYKDKVEESNRWQLAFETSEKARAESDKQTGELLEVAKTSHALIVAVFQNSEALRQNGERDVAS
jgi:hypothetical protein